MNQLVGGFMMGLGWIAAQKVADSPALDGVKQWFKDVHTVMTEPDQMGPARVIDIHTRRPVEGA